jgi:hypothetical protein
MFVTPAGTVHVHVPTAEKVMMVVLPSTTVVSEQGAADAGPAAAIWMPRRAMPTAAMDDFRIPEPIVEGRCSSDQRRRLLSVE